MTLARRAQAVGVAPVLEGEGQREYDPKLVEKCVHAIQMLSADAIDKAASGHPGAPMGMAAFAFELWTRHLRYDPADPGWPNRDRFILSCGHASMLLYALLHLGGYDVPLDEIKRFRQLGSKTPGHPESFRTRGVEVTSGALGQGYGNAVGMATSLKMMAARYNRPDLPLFTARVFVVASDGDVMEGVSAEASSLAAHLGLDNLVVLYDSNQISIDGATALTSSENVRKRYEAYGWHVQEIDGHDHAQIRAALDVAVAETGRPKLVIMRTIIGKGSPSKQGSARSHGEPLGAAETRLTKQSIGWPVDPPFFVPDDVRALFAERAEDGKREHAAWNATVAAFERTGGDSVALYRKMMAKEVPANLLEELLRALPTQDAPTRALSGLLEQRVAELVPSLVGGSADLTSSCKTLIEGSAAIAKGKYEGRNFHFGIREHAMGTFVNGMALSDGFIPFSSTFLVFSDYMRPALRTAAIAHLQSVFLFSHDSIYVGEDGPTHQPVEHFWTLRLIPNLDLLRPADALECAAAWVHALRRKDGPTAVVLTRQKVTNLPRPAGFDPSVMLRGAYVMAEASGAKPGLVIVATGSEVEVAVGAKKLLEQDGVPVRVVSAPCWQQFERQDAAYRAEVLPRGVRRVVIEVGRTEPWRGVAGDDGLVIGMDTYGVSAPYKVLQKEYGFTPEAVASRIRAWMA